MYFSLTKSAVNPEMLHSKHRHQMTRDTDCLGLPYPSAQQETSSGAAAAKEETTGRSNMDSEILWSGSDIQYFG